MTDKLSIADIERLVEANRSYQLKPIEIEGRRYYTVTVHPDIYRRIHNLHYRWRFVRRWRKKFPIERA